MSQQPESVSMPDPWERQPGEPEKAWASFLIYRNFGSGRRSLSKVREVLGQDSAKPRVSNRWLEELSAKYRWVDRSAAFDRHMDKVAQRARETAAAEEAALWERRRNIAIKSVYEDALALRRAAREMVSWPINQEHIDESGRSIKPARWSWAVVPAIMKAAAELEQAAIDAGSPPVNESTSLEILRAIEDAHFP